jgi:hypothetical protein
MFEVSAMFAWSISTSLASNFCSPVNFESGPEHFKILMNIPHANNQESWRYLVYVSHGVEILALELRTISTGTGVISVFARSHDCGSD